MVSSSLQVIQSNERLKFVLCFVNNAKLHFGSVTFYKKTNLVELESFLCRIGIEKCLIQNKLELIVDEEVCASLKRMDVQVDKIDNSKFASLNVQDQLSKLFFEKSSKFAKDLTDEELGGFGALIKCGCLPVDTEANGLFRWFPCDISDEMMRIDLPTLRALNILPSPKETSKNASLFGILNKCRTKQGERLLDEWLRQPLMNVAAIDARLSLVEAFMSDVSTLNLLHSSHLRALPNFARLAMKLHQPSASLQDAYKVYQALRKLPHIVQALTHSTMANKDLVEAEFCAAIENDLAAAQNFIELIEQTIDLDSLTTPDAPIMVKAEFNVELQELRLQLDEIESSMEGELESASKVVGLGRALKLDRSDALGHHFRCTRKDERSIRDRRDFTVLETSKGGGVRFTTRGLKPIAADWAQVHAQYGRAQESVLRDVIKVAATYDEPLTSIGQTTAKLDVLVAFAVTASAARYTRPNVLPCGSGHMALTNVRHPCVELEDSAPFIPNDVNFDKDAGSFFHIITGPNMGGKSTYIRSAALAVYMTQIGCPVACDAGSTVTVVDTILSRIGASDCQLVGVSTFLAEMIDVSSILKAATQDSLIIVDELGRGTSTYDGFGIAGAIARHLALETRCFCLFATHFHELTRLADGLPGVGNLHVKAVAEHGELTLLYKVEKGVCDQSFGVHVAQMVGFPADVLEYAKEKTEQLESMSSFQTDPTSKSLEQKVLSAIQNHPGATDDELIELLQNDVNHLFPTIL